MTPCVAISTATSSDASSMFISANCTCTKLVINKMKHQLARDFETKSKKRYMQTKRKQPPYSKRLHKYGAEPDVVTYNVMIKLCARVGMKDLLVFVLERILDRGIALCMTTLNSLVAAYVGFGDLETA